MSDRPFQRPGSVPRKPQEPWPYTSPGVAPPPESHMVPHLGSHPGSRPLEAARPRPARTVRISSAVAIGIAGLFVGTAAGALIVHRSPGAPILLTVATFPREVLGQTRDDLKWREGGSRPVLERLDAEFEDQRVGHRFAHGGDGATFEYGGVYALTIVNGFLVVTIPTAGDPPAGDMARLVSLRSTQTSCVSEQPVREFERRPSELDTASGVDAAAGPSTFRTETPSVWTDCVFVDQDRTLALRLVGPGPAKDILGTASQFRDELRRIHADLID